MLSSGIKDILEQGMGVHTCGTSTQEAELEDQELEASLGYVVRPSFKTQKQTYKIEGAI